MVGFKISSTCHLCYVFLKDVGIVRCWVMSFDLK